MTLTRLFNPVGEWRSLVAHLFWVQGVAGSNPVSPTIKLVTQKKLFSINWRAFFVPTFLSVLYSAFKGIQAIDFTNFLMPENHLRAEIGIGTGSAIIP